MNTKKQLNIFNDFFTQIFFRHGDKYKEIM